VLNAKYPKGWARLGGALNGLQLYEESIGAWNKAIECLPTSNLKPLELEQLKTFKEGLWAAESALKATDEARGPYIVQPELTSKMPWLRATSLLGELRASEKFRSSVRMINRFLNLLAYFWHNQIRHTLLQAHLRSFSKYQRQVTHFFVRTGRWPGRVLIAYK
jgi:hypothetical protein